MTTSAEEIKAIETRAEQLVPSTINILTYNVFGLKFIAGYRRERLSEIGRRLASHLPTPEIVALQECWTQEDYQSIHHQTKHILPFAKFYYSGIFGGGLAILSKWPIIESSMFRYPLNGRPTAFWRGDWYVGKGVACAKIRYGSAVKEVVEVFCTHLHAPYESEPHDSYICHRTAQAWEIAKLMKGAAEREHLVLGLGDFNMLPLSFAHRLIEAHAPVRDAWRILHPDSSIGTSTHPEEKKRKRGVPTAAFNIIENGAASDNVLNTFRWPKSEQKRLFKGETITIDDSTSDPNAKRLDYIFVGEDRHLRVARSTRWEIRSVNVAMTERHPTLGCSLSDHFAVEATISRSRSNGTFVQGDETSQIAPEISFYDSVLAMISTYTVRERLQRKSRLAHLLFSVFVSIACLVAIWWSPRNFASFILMLVSTLNLSAGVIDGLIGGLFVGSELRALKEFQWEIMNAKVLAEADSMNTRKIIGGGE